MASKKLIAARLKHEKYIKSLLSKHKTRINTNSFPDLKVTSSVPLSNTIPSNGFKKSIDDYKWKKDIKESRETIAEIERKKKRIAPYTNKGAYMFLTEADEAKNIGKKV